MNYKIVKKEAFCIVGVKENISMNMEENFVKIPQFWAKAFQYALKHRRYMI